MRETQDLARMVAHRDCLIALLRVLPDHSLEMQRTKRHIAWLDEVIAEVVAERARQDGVA